MERRLFQLAHKHAPEEFNAIVVREAQAEGTFPKPTHVDTDEIRFTALKSWQLLLDNRLKKQKNLFKHFYGRARIIPMIFLPAKLTEYSNGSPVIVCLFLRLSKQKYVLNIQYIQHYLHIFLKLILQQFVPGITT